MYSIADAGRVALEDYNGVRGGEVHKWYQREEFDRQLSRRGVTRETCNERIAVEALQTTSSVLRLKSLKHIEMTAYAGPQCFPQIFDDTRYFANSEGDSQRVVEVDESGVIAERLIDCWMRCGNPHCRKRRLVEKGALESLRSDAFLKGAEQDSAWKQWLADAGRRHSIVVAAHRGDVPVSGVSGEGARGEEKQDEHDEVLSLASDASSSEGGSVQGPENFGGAVAPHVLASLGGRGGFADDDRRALEELAASHGLPEEAPCGPAPVISFTCDMLQRQELTGDAGNGRLRRRWVTMSCDDEDDYDAMVNSACGSTEEYRFVIPECRRGWWRAALAELVCEGWACRRGRDGETAAERTRHEVARLAGGTSRGCAATDIWSWLSCLS